MNPVLNHRSNTNRIPEILPLLEFTSKLLGNEKKIKGVNVIFSLHHTGDLIPLVSQMQSLGLEKKLSWFFEIPYSMNAKVKSKLIELGYSENHLMKHSSFDPLKPFEHNQFIRSLSFIPNAIHSGIKSGANSTIILDDGGNSSFCRFEMKELHKKFNHRISIIEQTANGIKQHRNQIMSEFCTIINIAETFAKKKYESPVIAKTILSHIKNKCINEKIHLANCTLLVLGYGDIGKSIVDQLIKSNIQSENILIKPNINNQFYTINKGNLAIIEELHNHQVDIVIGCSGAESFHPSFFYLLNKKCLLINTSSRTMEFKKDEWVSAGLIKISKEPDDNKGKMHSDICFNIQGKEIKLVNSGFPINFCGNVNPSPPEYMQLTVALMLAGALESFKYQRGEFLLDEEIERTILQQYLDYLKNEINVTYYK